MGEFNIKTAQNITINQNLAGVGQRIAAYLIDTIVLISFYILIIYLLSLGKFDKIFTSWAFVSVLALPYILYYPILQYWNNGQTIGKQLVKIRIVKIDNTHPGIGDFLIRWVIRLFEINMIPGLGLIVMLMNEKKQRLGDLAAKTVVISEEKKIALDHSIFEELEQTYQPTYPQVTRLKDSDVQMIKSVFTSVKENGKRDILSKLTRKIEDLLEIKKPTDMSHKRFIETIIKDYNYYTGK